MPEEYVVVTIPISSGEMYIDELRERGYKVITLIPYAEVKNLDEIFAYFKSYFGDRSTVIMGPKNLDDLYKCVEGYNVVAVFAGGEAGVRCADVLARQLGLEGNDPDTTWLRNNKEGMVHALKTAGIRAIETLKVKCEQDIIDFWNDNECDSAVMKFAESGATVGVKVCPSLQFALDYYKQMQTMPNFIGVVGGEILIQEYIDGEEHVVDTVSCNGKHKITDCWTYTKFLNGNNILYGKSLFQSEISLEFKEIIEYAMKVLDAVGIRYGPCHTEIKYDKKGPVLIETNPRPHGGDLRRDFIKSFNDNCIVDIAVDSLLEKDSFFKRPDQYVSKQGAMFLLISNPSEGEITLAPLMALFEHIPGHHYMTPNRKDTWACPETIDFQTYASNCKFTGKTEFLNRLYEKMHTLNFSFPDLFLSPVEVEGCKEFVMPRYSGNAAVFDEILHPVGEAEEKYDNGIFAPRASGSLADRYEALFALMRNVKGGGRIMIPKEVYETMPYGKEGMKGLFDLFDMPVSEQDDGTLVATIGPDIMVHP